MTDEQAERLIRALEMIAEKMTAPMLMPLPQPPYGPAIGATPLVGSWPCLAGHHNCTDPVCICRQLQNGVVSSQSTFDPSVPHTFTQ